MFMGGVSMVPLHHSDTQSLSSMLIGIGECLLATTEGRRGRPDRDAMAALLPVRLDMIDAVCKAFTPWHLTREEAALMSVIWTCSVLEVHNYDPDRMRPGREYLMYVFGKLHAFDNVNLLARFEELGIIESPVREYNRIECGRSGPEATYHNDYLPTSDFFALVNAMRDGRGIDPSLVGCKGFIAAYAAHDTGNATVTPSRDSDDGADGDAEQDVYPGKQPRKRILEEVDVSTTLATHFLEPAVAEKLAMIAAGQRAVGADVLAEWGLAPAIASRGVSVLLHGPAGTGKTSGVRALAGELGRRLYTITVDRIESKWVGEAEKNLAKMFKEFRAHCGQLDQAPILLIDECEFLFARRLHADNAVEHSLNNRIGIVLKEMETLPGILICTTNLLSNLDPAFSRRFDHKILIDRPGKDVQRRLWKHYLKPSIPGAAEIDVEQLLAAGNFTGAIIERVVINTCRTIIASRRTAARLETADLLASCQHEQRAAFDTTEREFIGFA
ncbi:MAG: ATP-binding protein [Candidatus Kapabacteria bacterium]|nr:ATP-binding protein [Candidatus Kapabacteria bacterium]